MKHLRQLLILLLFLTPAFVHADEKSTSLEARVKAVVLINFAKYTKWPEGTFKSPTQPIRVCVLGKNSFGDVFTSSDAPKEAQGRPFEVRELPATVSSEEAATCQILHWQPADEDRVKELSPILEKNAVLTVSDTEAGRSIISFTIKDGRVRFIIRRQAAQKVGIEMSSQLLKLAILEE